VGWVVKASTLGAPALTVTACDTAFASPEAVAVMV